MKRILLVTVILAAMLLSGCASTTHTTVGSAFEGDFGDKVEFDVVRISTYGGGVSGPGTNSQYAFLFMTRQLGPK